MKVFYLDTSTSYLYTGIVDNGHLVGEVKEKLEKNLSTLTLPKIEEMFQKCHLEPSQIDKIIVVNGPGSFTGVRIGVTIAKIYAWSLQIPITTISSLMAMACQKLTEDYRIPVIDARHNCVYSAIYNKEGKEVLKEQYLKKETLLTAMETLPGTKRIITNDEVDLGSSKSIYDPDIELIVNRFQDKESQNPHAVEPNYLKLTEAEESNHRDDTSSIERE